MRRITPLLLATATLAGAAPAEHDPAEILRELRSFATTGTLLHVAAHPDDENTHLITYFARARGYRTAYLSLTRGDGGQNEIGREFDEKLGLARTHELLVARRIDGGRQFFTRAIDFGYSKTVDETLRFWDRREVLGDVVRVIRMFRPDVIVTRFAPTGGGTHGHHTASGLLGVEAAKLAGDPTAYPEQLREGLGAWSPRRVFLNAGGPGRGGATPAGALKIDIGGRDPASGEGLGAIASRSRGQHITQGFGGFGSRGPGDGPNEQAFLLLHGEPAQKDLFDGVDTTWARFWAKGATVAKLTTEVIAAFRNENPAASLPSLLRVRAALAELPLDPLVEDRRAQLERIIRSAAGISVRSESALAEVIPGETLRARFQVNASGRAAVRWTGLRAFGGDVPLPAGVSVPGKAGSAIEHVGRAPGHLQVSQPYWLREAGRDGIATVRDSSLIGRPENPPVFPVTYEFEVAGEKVRVEDELAAFSPAAKGGERQRRVDVIAPVSLRLPAEVVLFAPGTRRRVEVEVVAARPASGVARLRLPAGWSATPEKAPFDLGNSGDSVRVAFEVTAPKERATATLLAEAEVGGVACTRQRVVIDYAHLPVLLLQPEARIRLMVADVVSRPARVGYLPGAGDDVARALVQLGHEVKTLRGADLNPEGLRGLSAVVIGVRAFNEREDLAENLPGLWRWVEAGGTVIAQYNRPNGLAAPKLGPYELSIQGPAPQLRVTDETAPVKFLLPGHRVLNLPNRIGETDFAGWLQERGAYFPSSWDEARHEAVLAISDPGEAPLRGSLLVARHGKGHYVYTGLAFFRQLPAGVPGAYRLFANLLALGPDA